MAETYMKYGIDLGTTNSSICKLEGGELLIKKTDTLKDTLPSCVSFTRKQQVRVGDSAVNDLKQNRSKALLKWKESDQNVFSEFKRTMGLDTAYYSSNMDQYFSSEDLSAEVLRTLKSFVNDEAVTSAVVTVPAKFTADQIEATQLAAELAGITHCELLQEPIAASIAYGFNKDKKDAKWLVFDLGGGTFDVALVEAKNGIITVTDTEGDNYLGGKNLDLAIVDQIFIPYVQENYKIGGFLNDPVKKQILRDAFRAYAESAKTALSFKQSVNIVSELEEFGEDENGDEIELDLTITSEMLEKVLTPFFQQTIDICKHLLERNHIAPKQLDALVPVGGPTYSPILRKMLCTQISDKLDTSIDPMTAVAKGAALYASTVVTQIEKPTEKRHLILDIDFVSKTMEKQENVTFKFSKDSTFHANSKFKIEFIRGDNAWSSGRMPVQKLDTILELPLVENKNNNFRIECYDNQGNPVSCTPKEINIIQGMIIGDAVLPYSIGMEAYDSVRDQLIFVPFEGLEKNTPLPAIGTADHLMTDNAWITRKNKTNCPVNIFQGEYDSIGSQTIYSDLVGYVDVTAFDFKADIPPRTPIKFTLYVDRSQLMKVVIEIPTLGLKIEKNVTIQSRMAPSKEDITSWMDRLEDSVENLIDEQQIPQEQISEIQNAYTVLKNQMDGEIESEDGRMHLLAEIRRLFRQVEHAENVDWPKIEKQLTDTWEELKDQLDSDYEYKEALARYNFAMKCRNVHAGTALLASLKKLQLSLDPTTSLIAQLNLLNEHFMLFDWTNRSKARRLLDKAFLLVKRGADFEQIKTIYSQILLLSNIEKLGIEGFINKLLTK